MSDIGIAKYFLSFCNWAMGLMSKVSTIPQHQERCVAKGSGGSISEMLPCAHEGCTVRVHRLYQIDWLHQHDLEGVYNDLFFFLTVQQVLPELCSIAPYVFPAAVVNHILF